MPDVPIAQHDTSHAPDAQTRAHVSRYNSSTSLRELWEVVVRRWRLMASVLGGLVLACLLYCLIAPNQYEASARVALRTSPDSSLSLESPEALASASILSAPVQLETLAGVLRSDQLAWRVVNELKLYQAPGFMGNFAQRFPGFRPEAPGVEAQAWLLERFQKRLNVQTLPRTLLIQIRFRSRDAALSAAVVNALIRVYGQQDSESQVQATVQASDWLNIQLKDLKARVDRDQQRLTAFQNEHGILSTPETLANGQPGGTDHSSTLLQIDELGKQLVAATTDRIAENSYKSPKEYRLDEHFGTILGAVFDEIGKNEPIKPLRRDLQQFALSGLMLEAGAPQGSVNDDVRIIAAESLKRLDLRIATQLHNSAKLDGMTVMYLKNNHENLQRFFSRNLVITR